MHLKDAQQFVGQTAILHPHYDPKRKFRRIESVRQSDVYPNKIVFNVEGIKGGVLEGYLWFKQWLDRADAPSWISENKLTAPQLALLNELDINKWIKKRNINRVNHMKDYPQRSGNLETPVKPKHKGLMGQPDNPHGSMADKPGRPSSENSVHARPTTMKDPSGLENLGEPLERGISDDNVGDDANMHPSTKSYKPTRLQGPSETPGKQTWTSFGNRYPGTKSM